ncbi:MAG: hypothetical protein RSC76_07745 [Oscillospiraceae bacterium]
MNYILEMNAFYNWLWCRLMAFCNAFGWMERFTLTNTRLMEELGVSNSSLDRMRKTLVANKLIRYQNGRKGQCGNYTMLSIAAQYSPKGGVLMGTLNKQNETKKEREERAALFLSYTEDEELRGALEEFLAMRSAMRVPLGTERGRKLLLNRLDKLSEGVRDKERYKTALLSEAMESGWKTVYPLKGVFVDSQEAFDPEDHPNFDRNFEEAIP